MTTSVITGVTGQDGAYLAQQLLEQGHMVYGAFRRSSSVNFWRLEELEILNHPNLKLIDFDLIDTGSCLRLLEKAKPDVVYNLAAQSFVGASFEQPIATAQMTGVGPLNLLEAIRHVDQKIKFYQASTSSSTVESVPSRRMRKRHSIPAARMRSPSCSVTGLR